MLKNRDTASNPYRIPKQPTPKWIKLAIAGLFLSNLALIAAYVMLVLPNGQCFNACQANATSQAAHQKSGKQQGTTQTNTTAARLPEGDTSMPQDVPNEGSILDDLTEKLKSFSDRLHGLEFHMDRTESQIAEVEARCRNYARQAAFNTIPAVTRSSYRRGNSDISRQVSDMKHEIAELGAKFDNHTTMAKRKCSEISHYRYGTKCYYVAEGIITQQKAKDLCRAIFHVNGVLAIIKDKLLQKFLSSKLVNHGSVYWVGLERLSPGRYSSGHHNSPFTYVDGNRVQNDVWEMWVPRHRQQAGRNCVALKYDDVEESWYWRDYDCSDGFGYICQYEVVNIMR